jgi:hypothetical protein
MTEPDARSTRRRTLIGFGLAAVLVAALIAIVSVRSAGAKVLNENGDTLVLVSEKNPNSMMALAGGELVDVGGCLGLMGEGRSFVVVWPHGTTIETPDPLRIRVDGDVHALGDTIELGGGYVDQMSESSPFHDLVPAECRAADVFVAG